MFDIGWSELLVIAVVAIIVVGPKDLPRLMRTFGHYAGKLRRMAAEFQLQFEEAMREAEVEEVRKAMESVRDAAPGPRSFRAYRSAGDAAQARCRYLRNGARAHPQGEGKRRKPRGAKSRKTPASKTRVSKTLASKASPRTRKGETT